LRRFRFPKRYWEWFSGRIAAKCVLLHGPSPEAGRPGEYTILPDGHGRPTVSCTTSGTPAKNKISISHSSGYAVAIGSTLPCGIDIQLITPQILRIQQRCSSTEEVALVSQVLQQDRASALTLIWTVKEALKKHKLSTEGGFFDSIRIEAISPGAVPDNWAVSCQLERPLPTSTAVEVLKRNNYMIAWSIG